MPSGASFSQALLQLSSPSQASPGRVWCHCSVTRIPAVLSALGTLFQPAGPGKYLCVLSCFPSQADDSNDMWEDQEEEDDEEEDGLAGQLLSDILATSKYGEQDRGGSFPTGAGGWLLRRGEPC